MEHNKQPTYVETPVWYAWTEAREPGNQSQQSRHGEDTIPSLLEDAETGYHKTILDQNILSNAASHHQHPPSKEIRALWDTFVSNVHPVVKIFFVWDKSSIMDQAAADANNLSPSQRALCFGIYFIAALSLTDEECKAKLSCSSRSSLLNDFQSGAEHALLTANYASTGDLMVLQALLLYMVSAFLRNLPYPIDSGKARNAQQG